MPNMAIVDLLGHVGRDAELKYTPKGDAVTEFSVAVNVSKDPEAKATWFRCSLWGKRGESLKQYLTKGTAVFVTGALTVREYVDKEQKPRVSHEVKVTDVQLVGGKRDGAGDGNDLGF